MEIFVLFAVGIGAFIYGISQSKEREAVGDELQKILDFVSNLDLETPFKNKILSVFGVEFYVFYDVMNGILTKDIPSQYEELLIKIGILGRKDDIRLFNEERTTEAIEKWLTTTCSQLIENQNISKEKAIEVLKNWQKCHSLIEIIFKKCIENFSNKSQSLLEDFNMEKNHTPKSCSSFLEKFKKDMNWEIDNFEKELIKIKEKFLA